MRVGDLCGWLVLLVLCSIINQKARPAAIVGEDLVGRGGVEGEGFKLRAKDSETNKKRSLAS